jgi:hypothetical protein
VNPVYVVAESRGTDIHRKLYQRSQQWRRLQVCIASTSDVRHVWAQQALRINTCLARASLPVRWWGNFRNLRRAAAADGCLALSQQVQRYPDRTPEPIILV